jgi:glucose/arabinose dehydrogenase
MRAASLWAATLWLAAMQGCEGEEPDARESRAAVDRDASAPSKEQATTDAVPPVTNQPRAPVDAGSASLPGDPSSDGGPKVAEDGTDRDVLRPTPRAPTDALTASLQLPPGFSLGVFASGLAHARMLAVHQQHVYLTRPNQGDVVRLIDADGDGVAEDRKVVLADLPGVHGIVIKEPNVYVATPTHVYRAVLLPSGDLATPTPIIDDLPAGGQHPNRTLAVGPDDKLYITVGSPCDACPIDNPEYATVLRAELDGSRREIFARGLRNTLGFGWHPSTGELWGMDHGSDWRGNDIPPEELNRIEAGKDYGWPYCFGQRVVDPVIQEPVGSSKAAYCPMTTPPVLENQAHQAPIGLVFYTAEQFPADYRGSAFVALRGSWNRIPATGYKVARVVFDNGQPTRIEDFVSGFLIENGSAEFGRLAGIAVDSRGSLLFTDDENGVIYRVSHQP